MSPLDSSQTPQVKKWFWTEIMKGGDLSNERAPVIGIRFERVIKTDEGRLNKSAKAFMQSAVRSIDCNFHILTTGDEHRCLAFLVKWGVPFTQVVGCESLLEIPDVVREQDMITYYDLDREVLQNVNSRGHGKVEAKQWTTVEV